MLKIDAVSFRYRHGTVPALHDITLDVARGEVVGIIGPNGAGKTTLCLTFNGLIPHATRGAMIGTVTVDGVTTKSMPVHQIAKRVGMVLQNPEAQFFGESVEEELAFGLENLCLPPPEIDLRIDESLGAVRMREFRDRFPFHLSGGQKQRVGIATALAMRPEILVMDEPTSELDPQGKSEVAATIAELSGGSGMTVIVTSHETDELVRVADRLILLSADGGIVAQGSPVEVLGGDLAERLGVRQPQLFALWNKLPRDVGAAPLTVGEAATRLRGCYRPIAPALANARPLGPPTIEVSRLEHVYPNGVMALSGIDLSIRTGEFIAFMGRNGSGKTTLTKHFNALLRPRSGEVRIAGTNIAGKSAADLARRVGYAFQNPDHQLFAQSVVEEFAFGLRNIGVAEAEIVPRSLEALKMVELDVELDAYPHFFGKGERQKLALATILAMRPEILIIDEPTTGQDWRSAAATMATLQALNRQGMTVVFVTHDCRLVAEYAERVVVLCDGAIIGDGPPREIFYDSEMMRRAAIVPPPVVELAIALSQEPMTSGPIRVDDLCACLDMDHVGHAEVRTP